jgi:hypothetical protein
MTMGNPSRLDYASDFQRSAARDHAWSCESMAKGCIASAVSDQLAARTSARQAQQLLTAALHHFPLTLHIADYRAIDALMAYADDASTTA